MSTNEVVMTDTRAKSKSSLASKLAIGLAISAFLALGTLVTPSSAEERGGHQGGEGHADRGHDQGDRHHFRAPPVIYASPYCNAPPLVYGHSVLCPY
jgi:hypothetical protein